MSADVTFFESTPFFSPSFIYKSQGKEDDLLVYTIKHMPGTQNPQIPPDPSIPATVQPPIVHVYSRRLVTPDSCSPLASSSEDPVTTNDRDSNLDLPIALRKGKRQCTYPISSVVSYDHVFFSLFYYFPRIYFHT